MRIVSLILALVLFSLLALAKIPDGMGPPRGVHPPTTSSASAITTESLANGLAASGPYTHENLTIFLIHGKDRLPNRKFVTLDEAMAAKKVIVHETGNVNNLQIENVSDDEVYVHAGDIVKGGRQDRTFANDCIIPPKSGKVAMAAYCVESGRWTQRGKEDAQAFATNDSMVAGKAMKRAANYAEVPTASTPPASQARGAGGQAQIVQQSAGAGAQQRVWAEVQRKQGELSSNLNTRANSDVSASSYQLTLEQKDVAQAVAGYKSRFDKLIVEKSDAIGMAVVVNGKVSAIDIYGNHALFEKLWPKLIKSATVEALAEVKKDQKFSPARIADLKALMDSADKGQQVAGKEVGKAKLEFRDAEKASKFRTLDKANPAAAPAHENYLAH